MAAHNGMIMVINRAPVDAENLKQLIEFMDSPEVRTSTPDQWRAVAGDTKLEAVFVGADLSESDVRHIVDDVGDLDPNIPIVMLQDEHN
jgi:hypothetical protein